VPDFTLGFFLDAGAPGRTLILRTCAPLSPNPDPLHAPPPPLSVYPRFGPFFFPPQMVPETPTSIFAPFILCRSGRWFHIHAKKTFYFANQAILAFPFFVSQAPRARVVVRFLKLGSPEFPPCTGFRSPPCAKNSVPLSSDFPSHKSPALLTFVSEWLPFGFSFYKLGTALFSRRVPGSYPRGHDYSPPRSSPSAPPLAVLFLPLTCLLVLPPGPSGSMEPGCLSFPARFFFSSRGAGCRSGSCLGCCPRGPICLSAAVPRRVRGG